MPTKNVVKEYVSGGYYHIYNRGVNGMNIFTDTQDYSVFLSYLKTYLLPKDTDKLYQQLSSPTSSPREKDQGRALLQLNNFNEIIELIAYCLMPNHFHLLIQQHENHAIEAFMRSLLTRYTPYLNHRNNRRGPLFESTYKAVLVPTDEQLWYLTRYMHRNPLDLYQQSKTKKAIREILFSQPSSYPTYLQRIKQDWVKPDIVLANFSKTGFNSYQAFVESDDGQHTVNPARTLNTISLDFPEG